MQFPHVTITKRYQAATGQWAEQRDCYDTERQAREAVAAYRARGEAAQYLGRIP